MTTSSLNLEICRFSSEESPFFFSKLIHACKIWRSKRICSYPQSFKIHVLVPVDSTDFDIEICFEKFFIPEKTEFQFSEATSSPFYNLSGNKTVQKQFIVPKSTKDNLHSLKFLISPITKISYNFNGKKVESKRKFSIRGIMSSPIKNLTNVYDQVGICSISFIPFSEWEKELPPARIFSKKTIEEEVTEEMSSKRFKDLDWRSMELLKPLIFEKIEKLREGDYKGMNILQNYYISPIRKLSREILTLEETREQLLEEGNEYLTIEWIRSEIAEKHQFIQSLVNKYREYKNQQHQRSKQKKTGGLKSKKNKEEEEILSVEEMMEKYNYEFGKNRMQRGIEDRSNRVAALMKYQEDRIFEVLNKLHKNMETEGTYFPGIEERNKQLTEKFFHFLREEGFGSDIEIEEIMKSIPPEVYFSRMGRSGFGEVSGSSNKNMMRLRKGGFLGKPEGGEEVFQFPGDRDFVLTDRSRKFFKEVRSLGFGQDRDVELEAKEFFRIIRINGFGG